MSAFPAVATVIGVSKEVAESGPLLATLAVDPSLIAPPPVPPMETKTEHIEIKAGDPVTQAVVDNIIGKLPTKKEPVMLKCEICNITVSSQEMLQTHYAGAKHAKKVKGQELIKEITNSPNSSFIVTTAQNEIGPKVSEFTCKICHVRVNSYQQLQQHLTGSKHKTKAESSKSNTVQVSDCTNGNRGMVNVDIGPNRLYCAACNVHVNSDLQLHQHITSNKHANKVNGRASTVNSNRGAPYTRRPARGGGGSGSGGGGNWNNNWAASGTGVSTNRSNDWGGSGTGVIPSRSNNWAGSGTGATPNRSRPTNTGGWRPDSGSLGLSGSHWTEQRKNFVSGGVLSGY